MKKKSLEPGKKESAGEKINGTVGVQIDKDFSLNFGGIDIYGFRQTEMEKTANEKEGKKGSGPAKKSPVFSSFFPWHRMDRQSGDFLL